MTANNSQTDGRTVEGMQAMIDELKRLVTAQSEQITQLTAPKPSNRTRAAVVVVDGITLMDQPHKASQMKRLASASRRNLEYTLPLRLKAMKMGGKSWRLVEAAGVAPMVEVLDVNGVDSVLFDLYAGTGDKTDYYLIPA